MTRWLGVRQFLAALLLLSCCWWKLADHDLQAACGRPGPNSRTFFIEPLALNSACSGKGGGEGGGQARMPSRGDQIQRVPCSYRPEIPSKGPKESHGTKYFRVSPNLRTTRKRSFARMQKRLMLHGFSIYRGRVYTCNSVAPAPASPVSMTSFRHWQ